jgi:hypothetical protein
MCLFYGPNTSSSLLEIPAPDRFVICRGKKIFPARMENKGAYPIIMSSLHHQQGMKALLPKR